MDCLATPELQQWAAYALWGACIGTPANALCVKEARPALPLSVGQLLATPVLSHRQLSRLIAVH